MSPLPTVSHATLFPAGTCMGAGSDAWEKVLAGLCIEPQAASRAAVATAKETAAVRDAEREVNIAILVNGFVKGTEAAHFLDRKSTRLNSSHSQISYAVFCLKKKKYE